MSDCVAWPFPSSPLALATGLVVPKPGACVCVAWPFLSFPLTPATGLASVIFGNIGLALVTDLASVMSGNTGLVLQLVLLASCLVTGVWSC